MRCRGRLRIELSFPSGSMRKLRILIVEDDSDKQGVLLSRLRGPKYEPPQVRTTAKDALALIDEMGFDIVFVDLQLSKEEPGKEPIFEGVALGESIRRKANQTVVVMYSGSISRGAERFSPHYEECIAFGADAVLARSDLLSLSGSRLETQIDEWIENRKNLRPRPNVSFDSSIRTQAVKEIYGGEALESLVAATASHMKHFKVTALQAGYSGSAVLRVEAAQGADFDGADRLVLKVSRSRDPLVEELQRRPSVGSQFGAKSVLPVGAEPIERDGIFGVFMREVRGMSLLRDVITAKGKLKPGERTSLERLVVDLMMSPANDAKPWKSFGLSDSAFGLKVTAASEIDEFLREAVGWKTILTTETVRDVEQVRSFLARVLHGAFSFTSDGKLAAYLHGDFHCRNVFLAEGESPIIIDFGRAEVYPRLFDIGALDADLILGISAPPGEEHDISKISGWLTEATAFYPFENESPTDPKTRVGWLRSRLHSALRTKLQHVAPSEYAEILVFHFFRYLRFPNIGVARKLLATQLITWLVKKFGLGSS